MALKIINKIGPMLQEIYDFDSNVREISIGRDPEQCQVLYPKDFNTIGRKHLVIMEDVGRYEIRVNKDNPVYIDGRLAVDDQELPAQCIVNLGAKDGPGFTVMSSQNDDLPKTVIYKKSAEVHEKVASTRKWLSIGMVSIVAVGSYLAYSNWRLKQDLAYTEQQMGQYISDVYKSSNKDIGLTANRIINSVYLVLIKNQDGGESPVGTAWVVAPGKLATNAHVAEVFNELGEGVSLIVRSPGDNSDVIVNSISIHDGYRAFAKAWEKADPQVYGADGSLSKMEYIPAYDVAILNVEPSARLAAPLNLASMDTLANLKSGSQIAFVGYPMENLLKMDVKSPTPTIQVANVTSVVDFFRGHGIEMAPQLVMHSLPLAGGASGSPIFNRDGEVIALLNAGNMHFMKDVSGETIRVAHGADVNFAQRSDLLRPLLDFEKPFDIASAQRLWQHGFERFIDKSQAIKMKMVDIQKAYVDAWKENLERSDNPKVLSEEDFVITTKKLFQGIPALTFEYKASQSAIIGINAISKSGSDIDLFVAKVIKAGSGKLELVGKDSSSTFHPFTSFEAEKGTTYLVVVIDESVADSIKSEGKIWMYQY